ncbi:115aa long hypothetical protein [Pyrococcus horikoshii OT3]|uniref:Uncharacterized protein n=1 Tax=Pyrococcus horikoshii (strain ATCC 700860 / DSM 12428 / JCM 9974 / NBRC 100139 / OT-3) TaxID=70601 RepID=O58870_PYRHO|nr:115aa long hypothetical protein [Pyrococcus horikoshii OT3]
MFLSPHSRILKPSSREPFIAELSLLTGLYPLFKRFLRFVSLYSSSFMFKNFPPHLSSIPANHFILSSNPGTAGTSPPTSQLKSKAFFKFSISLFKNFEEGSNKSGWNLISSSPAS